ncbi:MAG: hypothetical protein WDN72_06990 [Alphaproteobacteria bacterium]
MSHGKKHPHHEQPIEFAFTKQNEKESAARYQKISGGKATIGRHAIADAGAKAAC